MRSACIAGEYYLYEASLSSFFFVLFVAFVVKH